MNFNAALAATFRRIAAGVISRALGDALIAVHHVGSTSVPALAAKPIVDILVVVADSSDEHSYLPALELAGYVLRVREPDWHQHRMLRTPEKDVHIHVFSLDSADGGLSLRRRQCCRFSELRWPRDGREVALSPPRPGGHSRPRTTRQARARARASSTQRSDDRGNPRRNPQ